MEIKNPTHLLYNFLFKNNKKLLTLHIILLSAYYRLLILYTKKSTLEKTFGIKGQESPKKEQYNNETIAYWIGQRVDRICNKTRWESKCLVKALIAQRLLHQKHIHTTLYLGVGHQNNQMTAHAWLRCGSLYVTGGNGTNYATVAHFYR